MALAQMNQYILTVRDACFWAVFPASLIGSLSNECICVRDAGFFTEKHASLIADASFDVFLCADAGFLCENPASRSVPSQRCYYAGLVLVNFLAFIFTRTRTFGCFGVILSSSSELFDSKLH